MAHSGKRNYAENRNELKEFKKKFVRNLLILDENKNPSGENIQEEL